MAVFSLNIYGADDEIIKEYGTDKVRWGVFLQALELQEGLEKKTPAEQIAAVSLFVKKIFPTLTDEDLENADVNDVMNTFRQLITRANKIGGDSKNGAGAV